MWDKNNPMAIPIYTNFTQPFQQEDWICLLAFVLTVKPHFDLYQPYLWPSSTPQPTQTKKFWSLEPTTEISGTPDVGTTHTGCPNKNSAVAFMLISPLYLIILRSPRTVLKSTGPQLFRAVPTFEFWPSSSWDIWD